MRDPALEARPARRRLLLAGALLMLGGCWLAHAVLTAGGVRVVDVRFLGANGTAMSGLLHIPPNATARTPAPGILAVHGYFNSRETQGDFAIEFARRGYVVLALDQTGHGYSAAPAFANGFGGPDGLRYLRSLDIVDKDNIGLEGHSMGGWAVLNAAASSPDGYRALALVGSGPGAPFAPEGTPQFPRNLAVIFAKFDEFASTMWGVASARQVTSSGKLVAAFDAAGAVVPGQLYGSLGDGTGRMLYQPGGTHPWNHLSRAAIGDAVDWFGRTLSGGTPRPRGDQIWQWKELGTAVAFVGFVFFILGLFETLLRFPAFASLDAAADPAPAGRTPRWWIALVLGALVPAVTLYPFMQIGSLVAPASKLLPQAFTNEVLVWALLNAALVLALGCVPGSARLGVRAPVGRALLIGALTVAAGYAAVVTLNALFLVDLRYWFMALKPMAAPQLRTFVVYAIPFTLFFAIVLRELHGSLTVGRHGGAAQYLVNGLALGGGFVVLLLLQYGLLFSGKDMLAFFRNDALRTIIAINFVPLMGIAAVIATFTYRRTGSYLPGAVVCGLLVAWYVVVGQATQAMT